MNRLSFRISSALKTILGKELITDDFIAVFELVKNSFDANAKRVDITFEGLTTKNPRIIIQDDGDGMNHSDIKDKWLFVAYSAKKVQRDYRDKIRPDRVFAGAKGIGRFSCDRLGANLRVITRERREKGSWHVLKIDWGKFEMDPESEFHKIPAIYETQREIPYKIKHGTVLEITSLRSSDWDRRKLVDLRRSLERLVNPNQENDAENFGIYLHAPDELAEDRAIQKEPDSQEWQIVNGRVQNFIFEDLGLKTTQIHVEIDEKGGFVKTRLIDRGTLIYEIKERNPYAETLKNIRIHLFALNQSAKATFTRRMGLTARNYGSVFLYKNGFRIQPFGNPDEDNLGIDRRKQQGFFRFLGTRDLSGRIEINGRNDQFQETSSRDGGLIRNTAFENLKELFFDFALKRLEAFVIELQQFGTQKGELPDLDKMPSSEIRHRIFEIIIRLTQSKDVIDFKYDPHFLNVLENRSATSVSALLSNLKRVAAETNRPELSKEVVRAEKQLSKLSKAKDEAEAEADRERHRAKRAEAEARESHAKAQRAEESARRALLAQEEGRQREKQLSSQNLFLRSALSKDLEHVLTLHHSIGQDALTIENYIKNLLVLLKGDAPVRPEKIRVSLERISYLAKKITALSRFATRANFQADAEELEMDLLEYVREYLLNVYGGFVLDRDRNSIPIRFHQPSNARFQYSFAPINVSVIFDNLISNARKHKAKNIDVRVVECSEEKLVLSFHNDGDPIPKRNVPNLFNLGFSTTSGSGLGLYHVREIMTELGGAIDYVPSDRGTEFHLTYVKNED